MTRENAIEIIEAIDKAYRTFSKEEYEALEMAIETLKQESCKDVVSMDAVIEWLKNKDIIKLFSQEETARKELKELLSVAPQSKIVSIAKWKHAYDEYMPYLYCSNCKLKVGLYESTNYCSNCGAKMWGGLNK